MPHIRPLLAAACGAATLLAAGAPAARANGDPASDVLARRDVFYRMALDLRSKPAAQLPALLAQSRQKGYEIKVAARPEDLGDVGWMWEDPTNYAQFLATEIA